MRRTGRADRCRAQSLEKVSTGLSNNIHACLFVSLESRCRSSLVDLQNPHCPICQISLSSQEMLPHIQQELDILERTTRQMSKSSARHSHLPNGQQKVSSHRVINRSLCSMFITEGSSILSVSSSRFSKKIPLIISIKHLRHVMK